jgi:hypothetical protein
MRKKLGVSKFSGNLMRKDGIPICTGEIILSKDPNDCVVRSDVSLSEGSEYTIRCIVNGRLKIWNFKIEERVCQHSFKYKVGIVSNLNI